MGSITLTHPIALTPRISKNALTFSIKKLAYLKYINKPRFNIIEAIRNIRLRFKMVELCIILTR